jgi:cell pole-organizing protein PopZ
MSQSDMDGLIASGADPAEGNDILDLTEQMAAAPNVGNDFKTIDGQPDVIFTDSEPDAPRPAPAANNFAYAPEEPRRPAVESLLTDRSLMSNSTLSAVDSAFNTLAQTVLVQNARTLEDLVKEMLRPMLKSWLDDNLPGLVERLVRSEIERVSRGRNP